MSTLGEFLARLQQVETIPCPAAEDGPTSSTVSASPDASWKSPKTPYWYFLEVLPPKHMRCSMFAFAEGAEAIRLFWRKDQKHFCQQLTDDETQTFCRLAKIPDPIVGGLHALQPVLRPGVLLGHRPDRKAEAEPSPDERVPGCPQPPARPLGRAWLAMSFIATPTTLMSKRDPKDRGDQHLRKSGPARLGPH